MQSRWRHHDQNILQAHYLVLCRYLVRVTYLLILTSCQEIGLSRCSLFINVIFLRGLLCHGSFLIRRKPSANSSSQFLRKMCHESLGSIVKLNFGVVLHLLWLFFLVLTCPYLSLLAQNCPNLPKIARIYLYHLFSLFE